jgi:hypothetical protein
MPIRAVSRLDALVVMIAKRRAGGATRIGRGQGRPLAAPRVPLPADRRWRTGAVGCAVSNTRFCSWSRDDIAIAVKLIDAQVPPYEQVLPRDQKKVITVDRRRSSKRSGAPS